MKAVNRWIRLLRSLSGWILKTSRGGDGTVSLGLLSSQVIHDTPWPKRGFLPSLNSFTKYRGLWDLIGENWSVQSTSTSALSIPWRTQQQIHTFLIPPFPMSLSGRNSAALFTTCTHQHQRSDNVSKFLFYCFPLIFALEFYHVLPAQLVWTANASFCFLRTVPALQRDFPSRLV